MFKKVKSLLSLLICISVLCTVMPITGFAAEGDAASVTFGGNTTYYTTIDAAWAAAVALDTTSDNKATIQLLDNCTAENTLTNTADYLVFDTNGKTLTTPNAIAHTNDVLCGISAEGGSLEIIGNGTISGLSAADFGRAILLITGGEVYANGVTIHNTGNSGSNSVRVNGGSFYLLEGYLLADGEYALRADSGNVYLYSGKVEGTGRLATSFNDMLLDVQICYSDKPLYFIDNDTDNWSLISSMSKVHLADNLIMDLEYSDNPDGSDSKTLKNVTQIDNKANKEKKYLKIQTYKPSYLFSTDYTNRLLNKIRNDKITEMSDDAYTAVHFVNLADYDLTDISYSDYSAKGDKSVKAWMDGTELYIGGYGKIIAGKSLFRAFMGGYKIDKITGLEMLDTSNVTNMAYMFYTCGSESTVFTLDLGDNFDTSKVKDMTYMFCQCGKNSTKFTLDLGDNFDTSNVTKMNSMFSDCGYNSPTFTLDLGAKFNTSNVTNMYSMFSGCGFNSTAFTTLDLSTFTVNADAEIGWFANKIPVTKFIFGKGWRNAAMPATYPFANCSSSTPTEIVGATKNLLSYKWTRDNRTVTFTDNITYEIIPITEDGGWGTEGGRVTGGGTVLDGESITLTATVDEGYSFDGWYDGDTKVCDTAEFVVEDAAEDKTYTAKFTKTIVYYTVSAESGTEGGTVSGGGEVAEGESVTLTATVDDGYTFDGWYDGDTKVYDTAEFVVSSVTADKTYTAKFTKSVSRLFSTSDFKTLLDKIKTDGITTYKCDQITAVHFVDLAEHDLTDIKYSDYSASGDKSVKAWMDGTELYIGGYGKIIAGERLRSAFWHGDLINSITGLEMLDTSNVTDMSFMFYACGYSADVFPLDLGDKFNTSNVTDMSYMFYYCGYNSNEFTLDLGANFDTSKVTNMEWMFFRCGDSSKTFTTLDFSTFTVSADTNISNMASQVPITTFIFGDGWADAKLPTAGSSTGAFYTASETATIIVGATENLLNYNWASDNRAVTFTDKSNFKITANAQTGGTVSGGGKVAVGGSITLTAAADDGYTFDGWYDGDTKVSDTAEFVVENVTEDKTYTAKFTKNQIVEPDPEPSEFDFTSLRTLKTKNITVNHQTKTIDIDAASDTEFITVFVHQKDVIPGGTFRMASYLGNKVVYDKNGSYRIYFVHNFTVPVKANITVNGVSEQYLVNVNFDTSKANFDFKGLKGENFSDVSVNHEEQTIHITANDNADNITLNVNQHNTVNGGKLRMASYLGNKVSYDANNMYIIYADGKNSVSVKANIEINGVTKQYLITVDFPGFVWGFNNVKAENVDNVKIDHTNQVVTIYTSEDCDNILLYIDQICNSGIKGQIWMKSYMGNKVSYNAADRTYLITKKDKSSITVKTKITMLGETRYYDMVINFMGNN